MKDTQKNIGRLVVINTVLWYNKVIINFIGE